MAFEAPAMCWWRATTGTLSALKVSERAVETEDFEFDPVEIHEQVNETHICGLEYREHGRRNAFLERWLEYEFLAEIMVPRPIGLGEFPAECERLGGQAFDHGLLPSAKRRRLVTGPAVRWRRPIE